MSRGTFKWLAAVVLVGLAAGACSNGSSPTTKNPAKVVDAEAGLYPESVLNQPQHSGTPKRGGTVSFGLEGAVLDLSPNQKVVQPPDLQIDVSVFDSLVTYNAKGEPVGELAETNGVEGSDGFKTWTVKLRKGIKFSNGVDLTADQVVSHTNWIKNTKSCNCQTDADNIASVTALDPLTVQYKLTDANVAFPTKLAANLGWITESGARGGENVANPTLDQLVGTGPFSFAGKTGDRYTVKANPNYWQTDPQNNNAKLPYLDKIVFTPLQDATTRLTAVQSGGVQIMQTADTSNLVAAKTDKRLVVQPASGSSSTILVLNLSKAPFGVQGNPKAGLTDPTARLAREALATALNRNEANQKYYKGARVPAYGFIPTTSPYFDPKGQLPRFDLAKATTMVKDLKAKGVSTKINGMCIPTPQSKAVFEIYEQQWSAAGLDVQMRSVDQATLVNTLLGSDPATAEWNMSCYRATQIADPDGIYNSIDSKGSNNLTKYDNPKVDAALDEARTVEGVTARKPYYDTVQEELAKDVVIIPLLFDYYGNIHTAQVSGLGRPRPDSLGLISLSSLYYQAK